MKLKRIITLMLIIAIFVAQISVIPFNNFVYAEENENPNSTKFHYSQLDDISKRVYDGIYEMYMQKILQTGTDSLDLAKDDKYVTQEQLDYLIFVKSFFISLLYYFFVWQTSENDIFFKNCIFFTSFMIKFNYG